MAASRRRKADTRSWPTRERILVEASRLFATRGFLGTSTRDIATAVGIQQPSMYSHFASKHAIAEELLRRDLTAGTDSMKRIAAEGGGPPVELYRYLCWEVRHDLESPFDLRSLYFGEILTLPEFAEGRRLLKRYDALILSFLDRGIEAGDFIDMDPGFAKRAIDAVILEVIRSAATERRVSSEEPDLAASFVLRALLAKPGRLTAIRNAAAKLDAVHDG
jgi:AcrR family transcriptional regulator